MKQILMLYTEDCDYILDRSFGSYTGRPFVEERTYPAGTTDWEILEDARKLELKDFHGHQNTASEHYMSRTLVRVVQIARDLPLSL
jgi:hypothetical protein